MNNAKLLESCKTEEIGDSGGQPKNGANIKCQIPVEIWFSRTWKSYSAQTMGETQHFGGLWIMENTKILKTAKTEKNLFQIALEIVIDWTL